MMLLLNGVGWHNRAILCTKMRSLSCSQPRPKTLNGKACREAGCEGIYRELGVTGLSLGFGVLGFRTLEF